MPYQGGQRGSKRAQKPADIFQFFARPAIAKPASAAALVPISSDQLPAGAYMNEAGRVGGMTSEDAGRLGGYMDDYGRVFVPAGMGAMPAAPVLPAAQRVSAGVVQPRAVVSGLTPAGTVDRSQSDEYKSQLAQYQNLIKKEEQQEAEDLGMKIFMDKYGKTPMAKPGGAVGAYNPLLAKMFPDTGGYAGAFEPVEETQPGEFGYRAQPETGYTMESLNPVAAQAAQQAATADQADMATTVKLPVRDRVAQLRSQVLGGY
jgi:hypothetical protein